MIDDNRRHPRPDTGRNAPSRQDPPAPALLEALAGRRPRRTPVWFMRQAGRSLPEYRALRRRAGVSMLDACLTPALAAQATVQPVHRHGVDAAVLFSDIVVPLRLAGVGVRIEPGTGPVIAEPVRGGREVAGLTARSFGDDEAGALGAQAIGDAVSMVVDELGSPAAPPRPGAAGAGVWGAGRSGQEHPAFAERRLAGARESRGDAGWTPLIGFGGAPFTLAAYLVEGRPSRDHLAARTLMHSDPAAWDALMTWCARTTAAFMTAQVHAGASAVQLFDSWAGSLSPADYRERVLPYSALTLRIVSRAMSPTTGRPAPVIHFGTGTARILPEMRRAGAQAVGIDNRTDLVEAITALSQDSEGPCPVQGNIDPALLAAPWEVLGEAVDACLEAGRRAPGHVVNLGHGVPPSTDPDVLTRIVARVHGSPGWERTAVDGWESWDDWRDLEDAA
ncbi:MAG: uroporphyrinogen decarboxylase [Actinomyces sp.]|uniref:uroporphyrinogen decarboxylase n=1 Tax=Actinomyces sp. TaxID=29317 RepID=UPI0026DC5E42|nr:uroporphyrinogen decarboxylase [Actinomyces sp.]MDO4243854.1 uroporphyrinogen decarboxylase [Actinomyces sp.]